MTLRPKTSPHTRKNPLKLLVPPEVPADDPHDASFFQQMRECREPYRRLGEAIHAIVSRMGYGDGSAVLDIGCGIGLQSRRLIELGWRVTGAEHSPVAVEMREEGVKIGRFDLTKRYGGRGVHRDREPRYPRADVVICTETAEHIPTEHSDAIVRNMVDAVDHRGVIVWSAAAPWQEWPGHINLQKPEFWLEKFEKQGWVPDAAHTGALRDLMLATEAQHWRGKENFFVLVRQSRRQLHFTITSTVLNGAEYIERHIQSVARQSYAHYDHFVIDAKSDDHTAQLAKKAIHGIAHPRYDRHHIVENKARRLSALENCWEIWRRLPDDEVIVWLDGDDWFAIDNALDVVARTYASPQMPWLTYGSFMFSDGGLGMCHPYLPGENPRTSPWRASHLKTFRAGLVKQLSIEDMKRPDGSWVDLAIDRVIMYPLLEMAGVDREICSSRAICSSHILSVYNTKHSWVVAQPERERQKELDEVARLQALPPKSLLTKRPW